MKKMVLFLMLASLFGCQKLQNSVTLGYGFVQKVEQAGEPFRVAVELALETLVALERQDIAVQVVEWAPRVADAMKRLKLAVASGYGDVSILVMTVVDLVEVGFDLVFEFSADERIVDILRKVRPVYDTLKIISEFAVVQAGPPVIGEWSDFDYFAWKSKLKVIVEAGL